MAKSPEPFGNLDWTPIVAALNEGERFVLSTHVRGDTDGIGSEIALHRHLRRMGKDARILNPDPRPAALDFLDPDRAVGCFRAEETEFLRSASLIVLDLNEPRRLGALAPVVASGVARTICIDHHLIPGGCFADLALIDPTAPATGAMVHDLLLAVGADYDFVTAQAIYATLIADTGGFRFSNTSAKVLRLGADLIELGVDPALVSRMVHGSLPGEKVRTLACALRDCVLECDAKLAWFALTRDVLEATGATVADAEGLVEYLRLFETVKVAVLFVEMPDESVKISLRSEVGYNVNAVAAKWGGGGHRNASGATLDGPMKSAVEQVLAAVRLLFTA